jgi:hypothetical protein
MITFKMTPHKVLPNIEVVEIYDGETFLGAIYPGDNKDSRAKCIRLMSLHLKLAHAAPSADGIGIVTMDFRQDRADQVDAAIEMVGNTRH